MFCVRYVCESDKSFWFSLDEHLSENEFALKVRDRRGYVISDDSKPVGIMRYNLFWDNTPFEQPMEVFMIKVLRGRDKADGREQLRPIKTEVRRKHNG